ncbi:MAG: HIT domain-containing protein, partial [Minisyncoccia bacterium]
PRLIKDKIQAVKQYDKCPYCDIILKEEKSERFIYSNDDFIVFSPFAPRFNYEAWVFPRKHYLNMENLSENEFRNLSESIKIILSKLGAINAPYNFHLNLSPKNEDLHFHFEITPRMNKWAGFELATDSYVITTSPENSAKFYKE